MNTYVNLILFEFVFVSSFLFFVQKVKPLAQQKNLTFILTQRNTVSKHVSIPNVKYEDIPKLYYNIVVLGLVIFIILGNITILELDWLLIVQRFLYNCGFLYGLIMLLFCIYFQFEIGFSVREIDAEETKLKILNSFKRDRAIQKIYVEDIAYSMIFSLLIVLISCRFFMTEGVFISSNLYQLLFSKYL